MRIEPPGRGAAIFKHALAIAPQLAVGAGGHKQVDRERGRKAFKPGLGHADNGERVAVYDDRAADDTGVPAEVALPVAMGEHGHRSARRPFAVAGLQRATEHDTDAHPIKGIGSNGFDPAAFRLLARSTNVRGSEKIGDDVLQGFAAGTDVLVIEVREAMRHVEQIAALHHDHEPVGVAYSQGLEEQSPNRAEDHSVHGDAERQGQYHHSGVSGGLRELAEGEAEVGDHGERFWCGRLAFWFCLRSLNRVCFRFGRNGGAAGQE